LMEAARGPVEDRMFPVGVITRVDRLVLHDLGENLLCDRQVELVTTLSGTEVIEPLLLRQKEKLEFHHKAPSIHTPQDLQIMQFYHIMATVPWSRAYKIIKHLANHQAGNLIVKICNL
jgi:hypothetical protein